MSSLPDDPVDRAIHEDEPMQSNEEEEEVGDATMADGVGVTDSSEEGEDDEEEEKRIREGFIVDEDEEVEDEDEEEERRRRRKRRKRRHRRREEEEDALEEDDLELLEENTGTSFRNRRLTRLRRGREDGSPPASSSSRRKQVVESSEDDLDDDEDLPQVQDIQRIWDDERAGRGQEDEEDMDDFIDYEDEEEAGGLDEQEREERRRERKKLERQRRRAMGSIPELSGIDAGAWEAIHDVFGDGHEYDWALVGDNEVEPDEEAQKPEMKYQDVFEPSEIRARMLTEDDDLIRVQDIPERMQLATSSFSQSSTLSFHQNLTESDIDDAAAWVTSRLSARKTRDFFSDNGPYYSYREALVLAVTNALRFLFVQEFEVPYIWTHKRDYISYFNPQEMRTRIELISLAELWRIQALGQKYRSLLERRNSLFAAYSRLNVEDDYFEQTLKPKIDTVEMVADSTEWLTMKYKSRKQDAFDVHFHDDEEIADRKRKAPSRVSAYEIAKRSVVSKLAEGYGIRPHEVVQNFISLDRPNFVEDQELNPTAFAEQFVNPDSLVPQTPAELLRRARMIFATELGKDPLLRQTIRDFFKVEAQISVQPTERGINKIDEHHPYFNFKYLHHKPISQMLDSAQFLHIIAAESEHLVNVSIYLTNEAKGRFERLLNDAFTSDSYSDIAKAWNEERSRVVQEALDQHLIPVGMKWCREWLREEVEDALAVHCGNKLRERIDVAPFAPADSQPGYSPSVLAISWGKGDPQKDAITMVMLDDMGRLREHVKIDNLVDQDYKDEFIDLLKRRRPDVIVVGGFSMATTKLSARVKEVVSGKPAEGDPATPDWRPPQNEQSFEYSFARIYQHSKRATEEFSTLSPIAKYCVGLARYAQNPLNEYAALGADITAISFEDEDQHLIPKEKLLIALERVLVDVTNKVGVDINRAVTDSYYQHLLPLVCGLGPRKAHALVRKIASLGGNLVNRDQFIKAGLLTTKIFLNAAGFLRISQDPDVKPAKNRHADDDGPDPLDDTRVHPEDYELARKMATDALELDEEDIHGEHPSRVVTLIMKDNDNERKLNELNLDEFAVNMFEANEDRKRHTLNVIREELLKPFAEQRGPFPELQPWEVLTMLSGETPRTLRTGLIISVLIVRIEITDTVITRLDSGIEGIITPDYLSAQGNVKPKNMFKKGQAVQAVVVEVHLDLPMDHFQVTLSTRSIDLTQGDGLFRRVKRDDYWNTQQYERDLEMQARKKRAETDRARRVIKHPNFHNFNASQAENFLEKQQRGDVVIRPSSKGVDHLAITWKVEDKLYQHIDVTEINTPSGPILAVDDKHQYADLDELIVNHVQAIARKVEELMAHEKFKHGPEDELHLSLKNFVAANPAKSAYGFTLNRRKPGHFNLCFLANKNSTVQTWPVRVTPESYCLFEAPVAGVPELCDAFKVRCVTRV
ncbi:SH2 domain-containing protein [Pisolithus orientalis]|uniref:SH2 domain-containing protein n=1 Tax=Pisolithus orientalis TaxID=936130 RepID=UPI002224C394|nr:SH2 domain-containing protein [Pisolithus orientalis]KAI6028716.1 SH2 domain-containing protein [Pisolithus orientalis]